MYRLNPIGEYGFQQLSFGQGLQHLGGQVTRPIPKWMHLNLLGPRVVFLLLKLTVTLGPDAAAYCA